MLIKYRKVKTIENLGILQIGIEIFETQRLGANPYGPTTQPTLL